jgi:coenzyme PQQ synthesis protein D (PqqD)
MAHETQPSAAMLESSVSVPEHVVYRPFPAETVLLNLETGKYHGLNPTGGRMLEVVQKADTVRQAASELAEEYDQPLERIQEDLCQLCAKLADRGLVEIDGPGNASAG